MAYFILVINLFFLLSFSSCNKVTSSTDSTTGPTSNTTESTNNTVSTPVFSPQGGNFSNSLQVTISTTTLSGTIKYTTDGSTPDCSSISSANPSVTITIASTSTIKAIGCSAGMTNSLVSSATFSKLATNLAPVVNAGAFQTIVLPNSATLVGSAHDDGLPAGSALTYTWLKVSGPGSVIFSNASSATTSASFSLSGVYELKLTVSDGQLSGSSNTTITVNAPPPPPPPAGPVIQINPATRFQTMHGWEVTGQDGSRDDTGNPFPNYNSYKQALMSAAVNDLGINRVRIEVVCGAENDKDYYSMLKAGQIPYRCNSSDPNDTNCYRAKRYNPINDNSSATQINSSRFNFGYTDDYMDSIYVPMKALAQAKGERIFLNINYVCFTSAASYLHSDPNEYAEFVLATYQHLQSRYGVTPDAWEMYLEPDTTNYYKGSSNQQGGQRLGAALLAAKNLLVAHGFSSPKFIAPSTTLSTNAPNYFEGMASVAGFPMANIYELSYHRYDGGSAGLSPIAQKAAQYGLSTAMLEWGGATYEHLHDDLKIANVSSWQQYTLSYPGPDDGWTYYPASGTTFSLSSRAKFLRQYFKFIREGAVRIDAQIPPSNFDPVAFINSGPGPMNGKYVVVVKAFSGGPFSIRGLPAGTYGIKYTTTSEYDRNLPDVTISAGGLINTTIPTTGAITIYGK